MLVKRSTDEVFYENYRSYGLYINRLRSFPLISDGLRPSERRILVTAHQHAKSLVKTSKVIGSCIADYHPHGDAGLVHVIERMIDCGLMEGHGNWGFKLGDSEEKPAAMRYTLCKISKYSEENIFKYISAVDMRIIEDEMEYPTLPTPIPCCLTADQIYEGIGFGKNCKIPRYDKKDLVQRLLWKLNCIKNEPIPKPDLGHEIIEGDPKKLLEKGVGKFVFKCKYRIYKNARKIVLYQKPAAGGFKTVKRKLGKLIDEQVITWLDISKTDHKIIVQVLPRKRCDFDELIRLVDEGLTYSVTFNMNVVDVDGAIKKCSVDELLVTVFKNYHGFRTKFINSKIDKINEKITEFTILTKIKKYIKNGKDNLADFGKFVDNCSKNIKEDKDLVKDLCQKHSVRNIIESDYNIPKLQKEVGELKNSLDIKHTVKEYINM